MREIWLRLSVVEMSISHVEIYFYGCLKKRNTYVRSSRRDLGRRGFCYNMHKTARFSSGPERVLLHTTSLCIKPKHKFIFCIITNLKGERTETSNIGIELSYGRIFKSSKLNIIILLIITTFERNLVD